MMKKILSFLAILVLLGVSWTIASGSDDQSVNANVIDIIDISVNDIDYGPVIPGTDSDPQNSVISLNENNNVDLTVQISVTNAGTGDLFKNMIFDLGAFGFDDDVIIGTNTHIVDILDADGGKTIPTKLRVPSGFFPGANSGVVSYIAMKKVLS